MEKQDWIVAGVIVGVLAAVGITIFVLSRKKSSGYTLKKVVLRNLERQEIIRDREGNIKEIIIHREVTT